MCNGPIDKRKQHLVLFHLVFNYMYDHHHYYSSHRLHIKIIRHLFVPPKNRHPFMSLEKKKRKTYKITDLNAKIRKGWVSESAESLSAAHAAQDSTTLPDSVYLFDLFYTVRRNRYPLF